MLRKVIFVVIFSDVGTCYDAKNIDMCTSCGETKFPQPHPFGSQFVAPPSWPSGAFGAAVPAMGLY